jgi:hypothetical protein
LRVPDIIIEIARFARTGQPATPVIRQALHTGEHGGQGPPENADSGLPSHEAEGQRG